MKFKEQRVFTTTSEEESENIFSLFPSAVGANAWRAFTLIELLVVIAIIGLLSSVVLASLSGARESARDTTRLQQGQQIRTALEMYYNSNGHYLIFDNNTANHHDLDDIEGGLSGGEEAFVGNYLQTIPQDSVFSYGSDDYDDGDSFMFETHPDYREAAIYVPIEDTDSLQEDGTHCHIALGGADFPPPGSSTPDPTGWNTNTPHSGVLTPCSEVK